MYLTIVLAVAATTPQQIIKNLGGLVAACLILVAGLMVLKHLARLNIFSIIITIALAGIAYLAINGTLIADVAGWWTSIGL